MIDCHVLEGLTLRAISPIVDGIAFLSHPLGFPRVRQVPPISHPGEVVTSAMTAARIGAGNVGQASSRRARSPSAAIVSCANQRANPEPDSPEVLALLLLVSPFGR